MHYTTAPETAPEGNYWPAFATTCAISIRIDVVRQDYVDTHNNVLNAAPVPPNCIPRTV